MKSICVCALLLLGAVSASAQTIQTFPAGVPLQVTAAVPDPSNTTGYRALDNGLKVGADVPVAARVNGMIVIQLGVLSVGTHTIVVAAFNSSGETRSDAGIANVAQQAPPKPGAPSFQLVIVVPAQ